MRTCLFLFGILLVFSCNDSGPATEDIPEDTVLADEDIFPGDKLIWIPDYDTLKHQFFLKKQRTVNVDALTAENLISDINAGWENVKLVFNKVSNDTLYVTIPDSDFLTQRMGSTGAEAYIASTTYSLTELKSIKFINYDFEAGDHLSPGVFSRGDFENFR
ncbi:MAG: hypothetical protein M3O67_02125 [Bacteroidota bacterium]|nr:hypothetical protein [Bacteroidota bacterium]